MLPFLWMIRLPDPLQSLSIKEAGCSAQQQMCSAGSAGNPGLAKGSLTGLTMVHVEPRCENGSIGLHVEGPNQSSPQDAVVLSTLSYAYSGHQPIISDISLTLPKGSRCLLLGANGAGEPLCLCAPLHPAAVICILGHRVEAFRAPLPHALLQIPRRL